MPRIQGLFEEGILNDDKQIKQNAGFLFSITVAWKGATVGDVLCVLVDSSSGDNADPSLQRLVVIAGTANGIWNREWTQGKKFDNGIYYREGDITGALIYTELTAK